MLEIGLPPLRARGGDVRRLALYFAAHFAARHGRAVRGISERALEALESAPWRGNVRELRNAMERAVALTRTEQISADDLPDSIRQHQPQRLGLDQGEKLLPLEEVEKRYILHALKLLDGNKTLTARVLGCDRKTLYRKLASFAVEKNSESDS